jgi:hypothetical protein
MPDEIGYEQDGPLGTVGQPLSFTPNLPFPSGVTSTVTQGWNGAWSHSGNLAYAIDFGGLGFGAHVLAVADGTVVYTYSDCAASSPDCNGGWGNAIIVDHGNSEFSKYTHLEPSSIQAGAGVGSNVCRGAFLATVGSSGNSTGPHIHFQVQSSGGLNGTSIPFDRFEETTGVPQEDDSVTSQNVEGGNCGEQPGCEITVGPGVTIVDDQTSCFHRVGQYWWEEAYGHADHHWYTYTIDGASPDSIGTWEANVSAADDYLVEVFVPDNPDNLTAGVHYEVLHEGTTDGATVDQSANRGQWVVLGTYHFAEGHDQYVRILDNSGEPYVDANGPRLLCDAVRFTSQTACTDDCTTGARQCGGAGWQECGEYDGDPCLDWGGGAACGEGTHCAGAGECVPGGEGGGAPEGGSGPEGGGSSAGGNGAGATGGAGAAAGLGSGEDDGGCGCRAAGASHADGWGLAALLATTGGVLGRRRITARAGRARRP